MVVVVSDVCCLRARDLLLLLYRSPEAPKFLPSPSRELLLRALDRRPRTDRNVEQLCALVCVCALVPLILRCFLSVFVRHPARSPRSVRVFPVDFAVFS